MADTIRYGIIGTGMMGIEHMLNIRLIPDAEVVAIADSNAASRDAGQNAAPEAAAHDDYRELLARSDVDAVVIATPNHHHATVLDDVFRTGLHALVEKPLCTTFDDCRRVAKAAAQHAGVIWVGMEYRYMPAIARLVEEVRRGAVGRLAMVAIREHRFPFLRKVDDWNRFSRNTGGTLVEKCCHFFDLMNLIVDARAVRVFASGAQDVNHKDELYDGEVPDILDNAFAIVDYEGGCRAMLDLCMFAEGSRNQQGISATGDAGKVECLLPESTVTVGRRSPRKIETFEIEIDRDISEAGFHHGATYFEHLAFLDAIRRGQKAVVGVDAGLTAVAIGLAAHQSIAEGRPVEMAEFGL